MYRSDMGLVPPHSQEYCEGTGSADSGLSAGRNIGRGPGAPAALAPARPGPAMARPSGLL